MSRYKALCVAIELCESARKIFAADSEEKEQASEVIRELQDVAQDVRYGGKWQGDYEVIAESLEHCAENLCQLCAYRKIKTGCSVTLKKDAAAAIRHMAKRMKELEEREKPEKPAEPAEWQKEIMDAIEQGKLPY